MASNCPYHIDHETRIKNLEASVTDMEKQLGNPAIWVALISVCGSVLTAGMAFAGVVLAPIVRAWLGV